MAAVEPAPRLTLWTAAWAGRVAEVQRLLADDADIEEPGGSTVRGWTALHVSVIMGNEAVVKQLLEWAPLELETGCAVRLKGLVSKPHLNGVTGNVTGFDEATSRFGVRLNSGEHFGEHVSVMRHGSNAAFLFLPAALSLAFRPMASWPPLGLPARSG